jgi:hypothetical protein
VSTPKLNLLNANLLLVWLKKFGLAQTILRPVKGLATGAQYDMTDLNKKS